MPASRTCWSSRREAKLFRSAEIDEQNACSDACLFREEVQGQHNVVDAVCSERDAHARHAGHAEDARQVVVPSAAANASYGVVFGLHFEDGARVIVESAGERKVEFDVEVRARRGDEEKSSSVSAMPRKPVSDAATTSFMRASFSAFVPESSRMGRRLSDGLRTDAFGCEFGLDVFQTDFIEPLSMATVMSVILSA